MKEWANYKPDVDAPYNSMESDADLEIYESPTESEEEEVVEVKPDEVSKYKPFNKKLLDVSPFRMEGMRYFPYRSREGEIPLKLLKVQKLDFVINQAPKIVEGQKGDARWTMDFI